MNNLEQTEINEIMNEIFLAPSDQVIADRFASNENEAAGCSGKCGSGVCRTVV